MYSVFIEFSITIPNRFTKINFFFLSFFLYTTGSWEFDYRILEFDSTYDLNDRWQSCMTLLTGNFRKKLSESRMYFSFFKLQKRKYVRWRKGKVHLSFRITVCKINSLGKRLLSAAVVLESCSLTNELHL